MLATAFDIRPFVAIDTACNPAGYIRVVTSTELSQKFRTSAPEETEKVAADLASQLRPGDVVLLAGDLGAGKTTFVRGASRALGVSGRVTSPTFAIGNIYEGDGVEIAHVDLYRLEQISASDEAVLDDFLTPQRISFVEWPHGELADQANVRALVTLAHAGEDQRDLAVEWRGGASPNGAAR
jgi:tRNA threonylcarbamoyladenosine biosynthesis protein TsaE